jgi:hypothetical protein
VIWFEDVGSEERGGFIFIYALRSEVYKMRKSKHGKNKER